MLPDLGNTIIGRTTAMLAASFFEIVYAPLWAFASMPPLQAIGYLLPNGSDILQLFSLPIRFMVVEFRQLFFLLELITNMLGTSTDAAIRAIDAPFVDQVVAFATNWISEIRATILIDILPNVDTWLDRGIQFLTHLWSRWI
jgi:hypothetical protein